jgi:hypothetical protein
LWRKKQNICCNEEGCAMEWFYHIGESPAVIGINIV